MTARSYTPGTYGPTVRTCFTDHALLLEKLLKAAPDDPARVRVANALRDADECVRSACLAAGIVPVAPAETSETPAARLGAFTVAPTMQSMQPMQSTEAPDAG